MTKEEANDFITLNYPIYMGKLVFFEDAKITARVKAIEALEDAGGEFVPTCYLEDPEENDTSFQNHLFSHMNLEDVIRLGRLV